MGHRSARRPSALAPLAVLCALMTAACASPVSTPARVLKVDGARISATATPAAATLLPHGFRRTPLRRALE